MKVKLAIVVNDPDFFLSHRLPVALGALNEGYEVHIITAKGDSVKKILEAGLIHHALPLSRRGKNPLVEIYTFLFLIYLFLKIKPQIVHLVTIKPVLYGSIAAKFANVPAVVAAVSGLGSAFLAKGVGAKLTQTLIQLMYRVAFSTKKIKVIFQNASDRDLLLEMGVVDFEKTTIVRGSGVDLEKYLLVSEPSGVQIVSFAGRLLKDKGVFEFVEAARQIKSKNKDVIFRLIGKFDFNNPSAVSKQQVKIWQDEGVVEILGHRTDIATLFAQSQIVVLPSYREGLPKVLVEAAACGRPVVTTDVPGCRDAIIPEETGLLAQPKSAESLATQIRLLLNDKDRRKSMGIAGRKLAEAEFNINKIVSQHMEIYNQILNPRKEVFIVTTSLLIVKFFLLPIIETLSLKYNVTLVVNASDKSFLSRMNLKVKVLHIPIERKFSPIHDLGSILILMKILIKYKPTMVHTVAPKAGLIGIIAAWLTARPVRLHTFQGEVWTTRKGFWRELLKSADKLVASLATHLLVVSNSERNFLITENVISRTKSEVLGSGSICGVDLKRFTPKIDYKNEVRKRFGINEQDLVILYIGRLNIDKGILDLIKAFNIINPTGQKQVHLIVVGPDEEDIFEQSVELIRKNSGNIHFESYTDFPEKYMSAADLLVLPSYREGFGLVIVEAAAARIPSVGSNVYGISDAIVDGETGLLFQVKDIADLAKKIEQVIFDDNLRKKMGEAAFQRCKSEFSQNKVVSSTLEYYEKILA